MAGAVSEELSLRERKKARTRAALVEVSQRLFADQGYSSTTLDDICSVVEVTPQTLLRYFDSKAHLALAPMNDAVDELARFIEHPGRHLKTLTIWQEYVTLEVSEVVEPTMPATASHVRNLRAFLHWTDRDPALVALWSDLERRLRDVLAAGFVRDWDAEPFDLHAEVVAAALVAGRRTVWSRWLVDEGGSSTLLAEQLAVIDYVKHRLPRSSAEQLTPTTESDTQTDTPSATQA